MNSANYQKKLMVCGCSFSALPLDEKHQGTHFSQILAKRWGYDLINNAYRGCSNGGIRLQMEEVIRQKPDFAIIIPTFFDRTEIPITGIKPDYSNFTWKEFDNFVKKYHGYNDNNGIDNINYAGCVHPSLICENYVSLTHNWVHPYRRNEPLAPEVVNAIKDFVAYLYDPHWKRQQDRWIIEHGCLELINNNIPFLMIPTLALWSNDKPKILDSKYYILDDEFCPLRTSMMPDYTLGDITKDWSTDPGYHTNYAGQIYLADTYEKLIKDRWNL